MTARTCTVRNATGIHTRPSRHFVDVANAAYPECAISVTRAGRTINGKSVLSMLALGAKCGDEITVAAHGPGEEQAVAELGDIFEKIYQE